MKRIAASVGLVAIGVSSLQTAKGSDMQASKPWSIAVSLRGFYDDNVNGEKNNKDDSFGIEISPTVGVGISRDQTSFDASYTYSGKYYEEAPGNTSDHWDHTHVFLVGLDHRFNPRNSISVTDSFVIGQEVDVLRVLDQPTATFQRLDGDNIRNYGAIVYNTELTELLGLEFGYDNAFYDYDDSGETIVAGNILASNSGLLDRLEHRLHVDSRWHFRPETVGILGYRFTQWNYTGDERISGTPGAFIESEDRDSRIHALYAGAEHNFSPKLSGTLRLGAEYADYYGGPDDDDDISPYALAKLSYAYADESSAQLAITHQLAVSDLVGSATDYAKNTSATTVYGSIIHRIMPSLFGTLTGTYQHSTYNDGAGIDDESADFLQLGVDLSYRFNPHFSAHAGYNFDSLDSDVHTEYDRNRVYIGVTAQY